MTPESLLASRRVPLRLVIFDCDGVLIDSEGTSSRVVAANLSRLGWPMTQQESNARFLGMSLAEMVPVIEAHLGHALPPGWRDGLRRELVAALAQEARPMPDAAAVLRATSALGLPWRICSNSSHEEMAVKFAAAGLTELVAGRVISHRDVARPKPAPDVFLEAARREDVTSAQCVVVEDSVPGVRGAVAAGMDVLGFAPQGDGAELRREGAAPFRALAMLPGLFVRLKTAGRAA